MAPMTTPCPDPARAPRPAEGAVILPFRVPERHRDGEADAHSPESSRASAWTRDLARLRQLAGGPVARRARAVTAGRTPPARAAEALTAYGDALLTLGDGLTHVELLHVAYWIDRLTIVLVQTQRWADAARWLDRLAQLPARYTQEITVTQRERLARRRGRCARVLAGSEPGAAAAGQGRPRASRLKGANNSARETLRAQASRAMLTRAGLRSPRSTMPT